jgi:Nucleotidyl transferase AbiEii toxin, Type IV TA system
VPGSRWTSLCRFGNVIHPGLFQAHFPRFMIPEPVWVRTKPPEQVVTEKSAVILKLTVANSRMKDLHDLWQIAREHPDLRQME